MKSTNEVIDAVVAGTAVTEEELRYAVRNLSVWQNSLVFDRARALTEESMTAKTKHGLQHAWGSMKQGQRRRGRQTPQGCVVRAGHLQGRKQGSLRVGYGQQGYEADGRAVQG